jgi:hypothetical protein
MSALMMEAASTSETSVNSIRLHAATTQKTAILILEDGFVPVTGPETNRLTALLLNEYFLSVPVFFT